ncbi:MAG: membrane dipeptidase [Planctomycetota bacterium]
MIFDGHLDLAMNALQFERDLRRPLDETRQREQGVDDGRGVATVTLPGMRQAGVRACVATLLARAKPWVDPARSLKRSTDDWPDPSMAHAVAHGMLAYYRCLERQGEIAIVRDATDLDRLTPDGPIGVIVTLEGADPVLDPDDLHRWHDAGLRTLSLAHFGRSHHAHGTPSTDPANPHDVDGPLTDLGRATLDAMHDLGMPLDLTHLSDRSFAEAFDRFPGRVYASHSACRAIVGNNDQVHPQRNLTDDQLRAILDRDGVVGLPLFNAFLQPGYTEASGPADCPVARFADHARRVCDLVGDADHVALGSDLDGGFGREHTPDAIDSVADLPRLADALQAAGFTADEAEGVLSGNWHRFWRAGLPAAAG